MSEQALRHTINVEACWVEQAVERNPIRQLVIPSGHMALNVDAAGRWTAEDRLGRRWPVYPRGERYEGWDLSVRATTRAAAWEAGQVPDGTWLGGRELSTPSEVLSSYTGAFSFVAEDATAGIKGLRRPQVGALHSVLGYWTTGRSDPATVVMPTGTGKTEAMLALLVAARIRRLVVVVPSDALRTQIASKFEALGLLQEFRVVAVSAIRPVVGQLHHGLRDVESACMMAKACNVIVTTPGALAASQPAARMSLLDECSHMFVDEAHHVPAATWNTLRDAMKPRPVVQFTATPYREDGRVLGGRLLYAFPLKEAQADGYFAGINYVSVIDFADPDRAVASRAVNQLRSDLTAGYDHLLMARVRYQGRAEALLELYEELASDLGPVVLHSGLPRRDRDAAKDSLDSRASRIVICVDMLGEGFDLPALKVAALHDPHRSLGVSLQFIGRFTRVGDASLGDATAVAARPERAYDPHLRALYAEDADWNVVISDLSEAEVEAQQELSDFESSFGAQPDDVTLRNLEPKMSTVVYRTCCDHWQPERVVEVFPEPALLTYPIAVNVRHRVAWFVTTEITPVRWGNLRTVEEVRHHLYVLYWDAERQLLYINSSDTDSVYPDLAKAVAGDDVERVTGENIYRVMANLARLVPTNIGVLDTRSRSRRFSMHVGADVSEGFPQAEAQTKTKTNIFATGYAEGDRVTIGASLKGRIWSHRAARTIPEWMAWCDHVGRKVTGSRDQAWLTASDSCGRASLPCNPTAQKEPEPIVVEVAESMADSADLLDEQVHGLGGSVRQPGGVVGEHLVLPGGDGLGQPAHLGDLHLGAPPVERSQRPPGSERVGGGIHGTKELLGRPGGADLVEAVPGGQAGGDADSASLTEALGTHQQQAADAIERIALASPVAEHLLLHPAPHVVHGGVGQANGVEVVQHHGGVAELGEQAVGVAPERIEGDHVDVGPPVLVPLRQPGLDHRTAAAQGDVEQPSPVEVDEAGDVGGVPAGPAMEHHRLV